jgi:hypothetical protein
VSVRCRELSGHEIEKRFAIGVLTGLRRALFDTVIISGSKLLNKDFGANVNAAGYLEDIGIDRWNSGRLGGSQPLLDLLIDPVEHIQYRWHHQEDAE